MMRGLLPRSLLARNIVLLVILVFVTQACSLYVLLHYVQRPRVERAATVFSHYISLMDRALDALPPDQARAALARMGGQATPPVDDAPGGGEVHPFRTWQRDVFMRALHRHLARETDVRWQDSGDEEKLWIQVHAAGTPAWIALPMTADVQASGMFADSKTFPDCIPLDLPEAILARYRAERGGTDFSLEAFVRTWFARETVPDDHYESDPDSSLREHIDGLWPVLTREPAEHPPRCSLLPLPQPYVVPGGRFRELYYRSEEHTSELQSH